MKKFGFSIACFLLVVSLAYASAPPKDDNDSAKDKSITGCLSGPDSEGAYQLKTDKGSVEVGGNDQLKDHVGHEVKLTGLWEKSGAAIGENESQEKSESSAKPAGKEENEGHFKVSKIDHISDSCTMK